MAGISCSQTQPEAFEIVVEDSQIALNFADVLDNYAKPVGDKCSQKAWTVCYYCLQMSELFVLLLYNSNSTYQHLLVSRSSIFVHGMGQGHEGSLTPESIRTLLPRGGHGGVFYLDGPAVSLTSKGMCATWR